MFPECSLNVECSLNHAECSLNQVLQWRDNLAGTALLAPLSTLLQWLVQQEEHSEDHTAEDDSEESEVKQYHGANKQIPSVGGTETCC
jgi:hypothetical protein